MNITLTINLYSILKFYLLGSIFGLICFYLLSYKKYFKHNRILKTLQASLWCILFSWLNLVWVYDEVTLILGDYFIKKNKYLFSAIFLCLNERWISRNRIAKKYYNHSNYSIRIRNHYYSSTKLKNNRYDYFDTYETLVEERFISMYKYKLIPKLMGGSK